MLKRFSSRRHSRRLVAFSWILALAVSAWVIADTILLVGQPEPVTAQFRLTSDPAAAARKLSTNPPLGAGAVIDGGQNAVADALSSYSLIGFATGFGKDRGFALLRSVDGSVIPVSEGETIGQGTTIAKIHSRGVDLSSGGLSRTLELAPIPSGGTPPPPAVSYK